MKGTIGRQLVMMSVLSVAAVASADVQMPQVFSDRMVLQRELPVPVWGVVCPSSEFCVPWGFL